MDRKRISKIFGRGSDKTPFSKYSLSILMSLFQGAEETILLVLLECFVACYQNQNLPAFHYKLSEILLQKLNRICDLTHISSSQINAEFILFKMLINASNKLKLIWLKGHDDLLRQIQSLSKYDDWSDSNVDVFFFIAHLQYLEN